MGKFSGKRAVVTGAGAGIGRAIALKLAEFGAEVYAVSKTEETLKSLEKEDPKIKTIHLDISDWSKTKKVVESLAPIQLLVNNAAIALLNPVLKATEDEFDASFAVNVKAIMNITQVVAKGLIAKKERGNIVNISSIAGQRALYDHLIYNSTKAAVDMMTKCFAMELGPHNIRVNAVSPTVVWTAMGRRNWSDPKKANEVLCRTPLGRFAEVEEVVNASVYLLSDESSMVNGHALPVGGGYLTN